MVGVRNIYDEPNEFEPMGEKIGSEVSRVNFVVGLLASFAFAYYYRTRCQQRLSYRFIRVWAPVAAGLALVYFCFGSYYAVGHILAITIGNYLIMWVSPTTCNQKLVWLFSMGYLYYLHSLRWKQFDGLGADIAGPIMIIVQKVTMMSYNLMDSGNNDRSRLTKEQQSEIIEDVPPFQEYMSYMLNFQTILIGPAIKYSDYVLFLNEQSWLHDRIGRSPTASKVAFSKLGYALGYLVIGLYLETKYKIEFIGTGLYLDMPFYQCFFWWLITIFSIRCTYYFAWTIADAICNMSGLGFNGYYDEDRKLQNWTLCTNVYPFKVEMAQNFTEAHEGWNVCTGNWIRKVGYERAPNGWPLLAAVVLAAVWHGIFIGHFLTFFNLTLFGLAALAFRTAIQWRFKENTKKKLVYDIFSFIVTKGVITFATVPFITTHSEPTYEILERTYGIPYIIAFALIIVVPRFFDPEPPALLTPLPTAPAAPQPINKARSHAAARASNAQINRK